MLKKIEKYFAGHPYYNAATHLVIGVGLGILFAWPVFMPHPVRWGVGLIVLGLFAHLYPLKLKK